MTTWGFTVEGVRQWAGASWLGRVERLALREPEPPVIEGLLEPDALQLRALLLEGRWNEEAFGRVGASALARWQALSRLGSLGLVRMGLDDRALHELADAQLNATQLTLTMNRLTAQGLAALLERRRGLVRVELGSNPLGDEARRCWRAQSSAPSRCCAWRRPG